MRSLDTCVTDGNLSLANTVSAMEDFLIDSILMKGFVG